MTPAEVSKANFSSEPDPSKAVGSGREQREGNRLSPSIAPFRSFRSRKPVFLEKPQQSVSSRTIRAPESEVLATVPMAEPSLTTERRRPEGLVLRAEL